jgi:hypothetical protein
MDLGQVRERLVQAITDAALEGQELPLELELRDRVASRLTHSTRELRADYVAPLAHGRCPDEADKRVLKARALWHLYPKDPCRSRARLDILWRCSSGIVALELKCVAKWKADTYGYEYLKDIHRLERMCALRGVGDPLAARFAAFVTSDRAYWDPETRTEPAEFRVCDGRRLPAGYWVQYTQPSPRTRWIDYPPFELAHPYEFRWVEIGRGIRLLLTDVRPRA